MLDGHIRRLVGLLAVASVTMAACAGGGEVSFTSRAAVAERPTVSTAPEPATEGGLLGDASTQTGPGDQSADATAAPGVQSETGATGEPDAPAVTGSGSVIRLGTVLPLQGGERDFGEPILRTTQAFIDELNALGGVNGHPLELVAYHACLLCGGDALQATRRLVEQDGVFALVNTIPMTVAFETVIPYLVDKGVPLVQGGSFYQTSDALSPVNFATAPTGRFYGRWIPQTTARYTTATKVGIAYLDVPAEKNGLPVLRRELAAAGIQVVREEQIAAAEDAVTNMDSAVTRIRTAGAQAILALDPAVLIFGRLAARRQGFDVPWVGPAAWSRLVEDGCGATCDDVVFTDTGGLSWIERDTPQMRQYLDVMSRRYPGGELTGHTLSAWVGMQLTVHVLGLLREPDREAFLAAMEQVTNLDLGTTSTLTFTPDRHLGGSATTIIKLSGGKFVKFEGPVDFGEADP